MRRNNFLSLAIVLSVTTSIQNGATTACLAGNGVTEFFAAPAPVVPQNQPLSSSISRTGPLQGGVKNESQLNPSLRLFPQYQGQVNGNGAYGRSMSPLKDTYMPEQIRGNVHTGGLGGGIGGGPVELLGDTARGGNGKMYGMIAPISSYNRTPAHGVVNYIPGSDFTSVFSGGNRTVESAPNHFQTIGRGVTVLSPELAVSSIPIPIPITPQPSMILGGRMVGPTLGTLTQAIQPTMLMIAPGVYTISNLRTSLPQVEETHYITKHGITTAPGYEVTITPPGQSKETLGGRWSANQPTPVSLSAVPGTLQSQRIFTQVEPVSEMARANVLTQFQATPCDTWPQWYRVVAKAIYTRWQTADVCPGTAKLEVIIKPDHDIQGRVVEFVPAADVERNIPRETEFRETAVKIVDQVGFFEIPDFPKPPANQVTFDIDLKRTVDGPTGVSIVGVPLK
ncbi:hypothetical protein BH11CYA1_BH11CYA1_16950 [soil metagenome]